MPPIVDPNFPQSALSPASIVGRSLYHANLRGAGGTLPGDLRAAVFDAGAYSRAVSRLFIAAASSAGLDLTGEEAQALILGHALAVVALEHVGRFPIVPDSWSVARKAEASGATVKPGESGALVVNPYHFASAGKGLAPRELHAVSIGCASLRTLTSSASKSKSNAGPSFVGPTLDMGGGVLPSVPGISLDVPGLTPVAVGAGVVIGLAVVIVSGLVVSYGAHRYFSAREAHDLAIVNAALAVSLARIDKGLTGDTPVDKLAEGLSGEGGVKRLLPTAVVIALAVGAGILGGITVGKAADESHGAAVRRWWAKRRAA